MHIFTILTTRFPLLRADTLYTNIKPSVILKSCIYTVKAQTNPQTMFRYVRDMVSPIQAAMFELTSLYNIRPK